MSPIDTLLYNGLKLFSGNPIISKLVLKTLRPKVKKFIVEKDNEGIPYTHEIKTQFLMNLLEQSLKNINKGYVSLNYLKEIENRFVKQQLLIENHRKVSDRYLNRYGMRPPRFCTISPTQRCNLKCTGCYASSTIETATTLDHNIFKKILTEMRDIMGSNFAVISGGEPFMYNSDGTTILDITHHFSDMFFLIYTNGTLLNEDIIETMFYSGNVTPAISVEGYEEETDERRGKGTYKKILNSMRLLRERGIPFGISVTATKKNIDLLLGDEFYDYYFEELGATFMWSFHLMPIGRGKNSMELMISPEERVQLYNHWEKLLFEKKYFIGDFWNSAGASNGCIAYARPGGYCYVDWNGNIMPCVFVPYYKDNINDLYSQNKSLADAFQSEFFKRGRKWQSEYGSKNNPERNWLMPCSIRDHYDNFKKNIITKNIKFQDKNAELSINDEEYYRELVKFDKELKEKTMDIWKEKYN
ncbi:radical SAM protein [Candidatus Dependentiae bacterium]|nr:radical SAM protein [Candidatus Dependentiae bacterium]